MGEAAVSGDFNVDSEFVVNAVIRLMKHDISERYRRTGELTDEDWEFCERIDWHPVDELPPKKEFVDSLEKARRETSIKLKSIPEIFE